MRVLATSASNHWSLNNSDSQSESQAKWQGVEEIHCHMHVWLVRTGVWNPVNGQGPSEETHESKWSRPMEFINVVWYEPGPLMYGPTGYVWSRSFETGLTTLNNYVNRGFNAAITRHAVAPTDDDREIINWIKETLIPVFPTWKTEPEGLPPVRTLLGKELKHRKGCRLEGTQFKAGDWAGHACNGVTQ